MKTELTLAIPTTELWQILDYEKNAVIKIVNKDIMSEILSRGIFEHRNLLENDPSYKQIIPYAVICYGDEVFLFHRTKKQTEVRLHNMYSLGVGGHMNPFGDKLDLAYMHHELERELSEEVLLHDECRVKTIEPVGFINDDTNEVGKVHLGVLYHIILNNKSLEINEKDKMTGTWVNKKDLHKFYQEMESWTKIYVDLQRL